MEETKKLSFLDKLVLYGIWPIISVATITIYIKILWSVIKFVWGLF